MTFADEPELILQMLDAFQAAQALKAAIPKRQRARHIALHERDVLNLKHVGLQIRGDHAATHLAQLERQRSLARTEIEQVTGVRQLRDQSQRLLVRLLAGQEFRCRLCFGVA